MIAAIHPCSFVDFPGRLAAVVFTQGCDLRCTYCQNPGLRARGTPTTIGIPAVEAFLRRRRGFLDGVAISGGEPALWEPLGDLLSAVRAQGFATKLDTNGMHPDRVGGLLARGLVDYLAVDLKAAPGEASASLCGHPRQAEYALATLAAAVAAGVPCEARTTLAEGFHDASSLAWMGCHLVRCGARAWYLQPLRVHGGGSGEVAAPRPNNTVVRSALGFARSLGLDARVRGEAAP